MGNKIRSTCVFFHNSFKVINEMHLMTYNIKGLNTNGKAQKLYNFLSGLMSKVNFICI
jgi:hypothetical protein